MGTENMGLGGRDTFGGLPVLVVGAGVQSSIMEGLPGPLNSVLGTCSDLEARKDAGVI